MKLSTLFIGIVTAFPCILLLLIIYLFFAHDFLGITYDITKPTPIPGGFPVERTITIKVNNKDYVHTSIGRQHKYMKNFIEIGGIGETRAFGPAIIKFEDKSALIIYANEEKKPALTYWINNIDNISSLQSFFLNSKRSPTVRLYNGFTINECKISMKKLKRSNFKYNAHFGYPYAVSQDTGRMLFVSRKMLSKIPSHVNIFYSVNVSEIPEAIWSSIPSLNALYTKHGKGVIIDPRGKTRLDLLNIIRETDLYKVLQPSITSKRYTPTRYDKYGVAFKVGRIAIEDMEKGVFYDFIERHENNFKISILGKNYSIKELKFNFIIAPDNRLITLTPPSAAYMLNLNKQEAMSEET